MRDDEDVSAAQARDGETTDLAGVHAARDRGLRPSRPAKSRLTMDARARQVGAHRSWTQDANADEVWKLMPQYVAQSEDRMLTSGVEGRPSV